MDIEDVKKNIKLLIDGIPYNIVEAEFMKPGKGRAIYRLRLQNLLDGSTLDRTYHSAEKVEEAPINTQEMQYLYKEGDQYIFMNTGTFEQIPINGDLIGDKIGFMKEGSVATVLMLGERPIGITPPTFVELKVVASASGSRADTITAQTKQATMETGHIMGVPTFVKEGDTIKVDTRTGTYVERVTKK